uniref:HECT domain-containing protein n=1 Tax=Paramormyrops kingsleyae TaxID=1676925 RepID=A0A3B3RWB1_9TELE
MFQVTHATTEELPDLIDDILSCGYTGVICLGKKDEILRTIVLHYLARLLPMLQDMRKGLQLYNLQKVMELDTELCQPLFVPLEDDKPDADFIMAHCTPHLSEKGMMRHTLEMDILNNFQDFLQEAEDSGEPNIRGLTVPAILQWLTGQAHKPILPSEKNSFKIHIKFNHDCYTEPHAICFPTVTACSNTIMFPTAHMKSYAEFRNVMALALRFGNTFSRI